MSQVAEKRGGMPAMLKDAAFVWEDPLDLEGELSEEERMVRDTARGFSQSYLAPRVVEAYRDEKYDAGLLPEMGKLGLLGPTIPEEYGGAGLGYVAYGLITRDLERAGRACRGGLGEARQCHSRLPGGARHQRFLHAEDRGQVVAARVDYRRDRAGRLPGAGREPAAERERPRRPVRLPQQCPLRHFLGRDGRGGILLASRASIRARAQAVRSSARRQSTGAEEACRHADRNRDRPAGRIAAWAYARSRQGIAAVDFADEAQQLRQGARHRSTCARHARWQRYLRGIPRDARALEPRDGEYLRRHARYSRVDPRARTDRYSGVFLIRCLLHGRYGRDIPGHCN